MRVGVMQGSLQDFDLAAVLQVVGLGRQYTGVEVHLENGQRGVVYVKSGKVVRVEADELSGAAALSKLFGISKGDFYVFRSETPEALPEPVGSLSRLLIEARSGATQSEPTSATPIDTIAPAAPEPKTDTGYPVPDAPSPAPAARLPQPRSLVRHSAEDSRFVVAVTSPKGGCGKSTIALNLALSLARRGNSVLLVDADINGDILSSLDAREKAKVGALDVINEKLPLHDAMLDTALPQFKIIPAVGNELPPLEVLEADHGPAWRSLLEDASKLAEVVVVDTPAGMFGTTRQVLSAATHALGVLQAEAIAERSFQRFLQGLALVGPTPPEVLGIVLNMLQTRHSASLSVFQKACSADTAQWLFDTTIPRHPAFLDASFEGTPLRPLDEQAPAAVGFLFDNLASEVAERLALPAPKRRAQPLLL